MRKYFHKIILENIHKLKREMPINIMMLAKHKIDMTRKEIPLSTK